MLAPYVKATYKFLTLSKEEYAVYRDHYNGVVRQRQKFGILFWNFSLKKLFFQEQICIFLSSLRTRLNILKKPNLGLVDIFTGCRIGTCSWNLKQRIKTFLFYPFSNPSEKSASFSRFCREKEKERLTLTCCLRWFIRWK